jgi:hypothetical protein
MILRRGLLLGCLAGFGFGWPGAAIFAGETAPAKSASPAAPSTSKIGEFLQDLLPLAWQKRPQIRFNVYTDMSAEGRRRTPPTPEHPLYYFASDLKFQQTGWSVAGGEKPPPVVDVAAAMKKALEANGYIPISDAHPHPDLLIVMTYGSHGTDPAQADDSGGPPLMTAIDLLPVVLKNPDIFRDVIERVSFMGGERFAQGLRAALNGEIQNRNSNYNLARAGLEAMYPTAPDGDSPYMVFMSEGNSALMEHLAEVAFHTCYFVVATAYDFGGVERHQKIPLWQTRMTVEAQGVAMNEVLRPLINNTGQFLGREMNEASVITKRLDREGRVEVGTPTVVPDVAPAEPAKNPK